ncbi:glucose-6-phosphate dehydrogenase [Buchnera aphidicola (Mindarus keteleerifoliae)]|uniref:glucose-6-phosphate dehydrogenase n=1 Tax=Buchnera aphidicola TaxID=9 RepID=UPI0031B71608
MHIEKKEKLYDLVIFGAKGDLTIRKLLPSLYKLEKNEKIFKNTRIIGIGRANWNRIEYFKIVKKALINYLHFPLEKKVWKLFKSRIFFYNLDINENVCFEQLKKILNPTENITIYYLAMPANTFETVCKGLNFFNLNGKNTRIVIEKPIGDSFKSSEIINKKINTYFKESQIFRIDHYLGKETILNLLSLRFANTLFFNNWSNKIIDHIQITVSEEVGIEGRWKYFEKTGQIKDMVQNHLLQILSIIAMSPPKSLNANDIRNEKVKVLQSLRLINRQNILKNTVLGQYSFGMINGKKIKSYLNEEGIKKNSCTETFVAIRTKIDNFRWKGVSFYLRTGKRLPKKCSKIVIYFKKMPINLFNHSCINIPQNKLTIHLEPNEGIDFQIINKIPGLQPKYLLDTVKLNFNYSKTFSKNSLSDAYERLLLESMTGNQALFVSHKEIKASWKWIDAITKSWLSTNQTPILYKAGTWGPEKESNELINQDNQNWD